MVYTGEISGVNGLKSLSNRVTEYFLEMYEIDDETDYVIEQVLAKDLINYSRFDLMAKWIYLDFNEKNMDMSLAYEIYKDNINAFSCGTCVEAGKEYKNSIEKYISEFNGIIKNIKERGFDNQKSLIPLGCNGEIFDGAHRVTTAAYYDKKVEVARFFDKRPGAVFDYLFFRKHLMSETNMGYMALSYANEMTNCYMACIWPVAERKHVELAESYIKEIGDVVFSQDVYLTYNGLKNFMIQIYGHQNWVGSIDSKYSGVDEKVKACYQKSNPVRTILFQTSEFSKVLEVKDRIRKMYNLGNHSIHISDNQKETRMMAELLYNPNSLYFLNHAQTYEFSKIHKELKKVKEWIDNEGLDSNRFIIDSSSVLEICGLRAAKDIDYLTDYESIDISIDGIDVDEHSSQLKYHKITINDMLYNPQNYFFFDGMKFLSVEKLKEMKECRNEEKDKLDVALCNEYLNRSDDVPKEYRREILDQIRAIQMQQGKYGQGISNYKEYKYRKLKVITYFLKKPFRYVKRKAKILITMLLRRG